MVAGAAAFAHESHALGEIQHLVILAQHVTDNALDATLPEALQGKVAIALAKAAYDDWEKFFSSPEFAGLAAKSANRMQLLWASTGTKDKAYSDVLYVEELIGADTVNTMPPATVATQTTRPPRAPGSSRRKSPSRHAPRQAFSQAAAISGAKRARAFAQHDARSMNMPLFQRNSPDSRYRAAVAASGFSRNPASAKCWIRRMPGNRRSCRFAWPVMTAETVHR